MPVARTLAPSGSLDRAFSRLSAGRNSFLLDSARFHPQTGAYSFCGREPFLTVTGWPSGLEIRQDGASTFMGGNPLDLLGEILALWPVRRREDLPPFQGGALVLLGYELASAIEPRLGFLEAPCGEPLLRAAFYDTLAALDQAARVVHLVTWLRPDDGSWARACERAERRLAALERDLLQAGGHDAGAGEFCAGAVRSNVTREDFTARVRRVKSYLASGDIYQANLSQRFSFRWSGDPWRLYERLREINPSPFAAYVRFGDLTVVSASPERLVRLRGCRAETRPIAGTRPANQDGRESAALAQELFLSEKERAEHLMLLDLERNDLGRVARFDSVRVSEMMTLERYSHVQHIVSNVCAELSEGAGPVDLVRAMFPGGTITGCPKVRCMEIIHELERTPRGLYTGSLGYMAQGGDLDLSILIRTLTLKPGFGTFQVGAGIVTDSRPEKEYEETLHKGEALARAFGARLL